jgi:hypothetical protein
MPVACALALEHRRLRREHKAKVWGTASGSPAVARGGAVRCQDLRDHETPENIFASGELAETSVVSILETAATDGKSYKTRFYNLDAIIAVGYRKHAPRGKKSDVTIARNCLSEAHVKELNRIVSAYLDLGENRAQRGILMKMHD